jgi:FMN phosphatase YigB (HAD superfamily)
VSAKPDTPGRPVDNLGIVRATVLGGITARGVAFTPRKVATLTDAQEAGHPLLENVHRIIADRSCSVLTLDIFDTVLWRRVPRPADVFGILGARLRAAGLCPEWVTDATFRQMRIRAEKKSRKSRDALGTEVSLFDIWRAMPAGVFDSALLEELVAAEVALEREFTVVDLDIADVINAARKHDIPVVFVSDTYFTEEHLATLLDRPELGSLQDIRIFRSHQHGVDKGHGLWEVVLRDLGRSPEQLVHIGDNEVADVEVPTELGVRAVLYRRLDDEYVTVLEREQEPVEYFGDYAPNLDEKYGDFGLTSLRAKAVQGLKPKTTTALDTATRYGASVLGPVLTGFAEWVAQRAHDTGTKVLWCPMREGELLSELVNNAARARGLDVEAKPIWLSRHVTSIAGVDCLDIDAVHHFIRRSYQLTVRQLLSVLSLRAGEVPALANELDTVIDNGGIAERVSEALTETPHIRNRLTVAVTAARERLVKSLRRTGALDRPELTLVDLGWAGTIQTMLARALKIAGIDVKPAGLYLATDERSERAYTAGLRIEGYLAQAGYPTEVASVVSRSPEVLEQSVNALCGSLVGFTEDGGPVLGQTADSLSQNAERTAVQEGILAFQRTWNRHVLNAGSGWPDLMAPAARTRLANILVSALKVPTPNEAAVFGNWVHEDNFGSSMVSTMLPADLKPAIPYLSPNDLDDLHMRDAFWPALIAASDVQLAEAVRAVNAGHIDKDVFEASGEKFETVMYHRTVDGVWRKSSEHRVRINHNGLSFARLGFEHHDTVEVSLAIPGRPAVVRVDWIEARVIAGGHRREEAVRWDTPEDFAGLVYSNSRWLGGNLIEFSAPDAVIVLPLAARAGTPVVSSGQISVAFAMLPQSMTAMSPGMPGAKRLARISGRLREEYRTKGVTGVAAGAARVAMRKLGGTP